MRLLENKTNTVVIETDNRIILISYKTCVAYIYKALNGKIAIGYRTKKKWSVTTSKHIGKFFNEYLTVSDICEREQIEFDQMLDEVQP